MSVDCVVFKLEYQLLGIPNGATVERMVVTPFDTVEHIVLNIREADFSTSTAITEAINAFGDGTAKALDGVSIGSTRHGISQRVSFLSMVENLDVSGEPPGRNQFKDGTG